LCLLQSPRLFSEFLGPVWNRGIKNVGMVENIGIGKECGGKTEE